MTHSFPDPIRTDGSNDFARRSMAERVPSIITDVVEHNPDYPPSIKEDLWALREAIVSDDPIQLFPPPAPDYDLWARRFADHEGETWLGTEWFFCEMLTYRHVVDVCRYWTTRRDPFRPFKKDEIESEALRTTVAPVLTEEGTVREQLHHRLVGALWGNRMDLSMKGVLEQGTEAKDEHLLVNDVPAAVDQMLSGPPAPVHVLMDNAGTEEAFDLALADLILGEGIARTVVLHVKMSPVLVGDVIGEDIFWMLDVMEEHGGPLQLLTQRIRDYIRDGRLHIVPDFFWNTDGRMWEVPPRLEGPFREAQLVISKGDANYRRATHDAVWPPDARLEEALRDFPAPFLALRTLKSDTLVGVPPATVRRLDREEDHWRTKGTYGVAQYAA